MRRSTYKPQIQEEIEDTDVVLGPNEYLDYEGNIIKRIVSSTNPFEFPEGLKRKGYSYQWCRASCKGEDRRMNEIPLMEKAGWRKVSVDALEGYYRDMSLNDKYIHVQDSILMERPERMTIDAINEYKHEADINYARSVRLVKDEDPGRSCIPSIVQTLGYQMMEQRKRSRIIGSPDLPGSVRELDRESFN